MSSKCRIGKKCSDPPSGISSRRPRGRAHGSHAGNEQGRRCEPPALKLRARREYPPLASRCISPSRIYLTGGSLGCRTQSRHPAPSSCVQCHLDERFLDDSGLGGHAAKRAQSPPFRCHPERHSSQASSDLPTRLQLLLRRPLNRRLRLSSRDCIHHHWWPDLHRQQLSHTPSFPGSPSPRSPARFACLRSVEFVEQTTGLSRTVRFSGASPDFPRANPLSHVVLIIVFSVHFQDCQALRPYPVLAPLMPSRALTRLRSRRDNQLLGATPVTRCSRAALRARFESSLCAALQASNATIISR